VVLSCLTLHDILVDERLDVSWFGRAFGLGVVETQLTVLVATKHVHFTSLGHAHRVRGTSAHKRNRHVLQGRNTQRTTLFVVVAMAQLTVITATK